MYISKHFFQDLAPGLRLAGWSPFAGDQKLVLAKQGADLHTATFNQIVAYEVAEVVSWTAYLVDTRYMENDGTHAGRNGRVIPSWSSMDQTERRIIPWGMLRKEWIVQRYSSSSAAERCLRSRNLILCNRVVKTPCGWTSPMQPWEDKNRNWTVIRILKETIIAGK